MKRQKSKLSTNLNSGTVENAAHAQEEGSELQKLKTFIVKLGLRTWGVETPIDNFSTRLLRAENYRSALKKAERIHMPKAFMIEPQGEWVWFQLESNDADRRGFLYDEDCNEVDADCLHWVEKVIEVADEDVAAIERYLD